MGGNDRLADGPDNDSLDGGSGGDRFLLQTFGADVILDAAGRDAAT